MTASRPYCDDCGERYCDGCCPNCHSDLHLLLTQSEDISHVSIEFIDRVDEQSVQLQLAKESR